MHPTTRTVAFGAVIALTAAATWSLAQAGGAVASSDGGHLAFFIHDTKQATVASDPPKANQGDLFVYHGVVLDRKGGKQIGRFGGACVQLDATTEGDLPSDSSCSVDYVLPGGQLHTEIFGDNEVLFSGKPFPFSVLGGTGKYRAARGEGTMRIPTEVKDQADGYVTIKLR